MVTVRQWQRFAWLAVLLVAGCSQSHGFSEEVADNYMRACTASGQSSPARCSCMMHEFERDYSDQAFRDLDQEMRTTLRIPDSFAQALAAAAKTCGS